MLEVTAKNEKGEEIFRDEREYKMVGRDAKGDVTIDGWKIVSFEDAGALQPGEVQKETFEVAVPQEAKAVSVEAILLYQKTPASELVPMTRASHRWPLQ